MFRPFELETARVDRTNLFFIALIGGFMAFTICYFIVISRYSGAALWAFVLIMVAFSALIILILINKIMKRSKIVLKKGSERKNSKSDLMNLRDMLKRADNGLRYSQLVVKEKFIQVLFNKIRVENNLTSDEVQDLRDPDVLKRFIKDQALLDFTVSCLTELSDWHASLEKRAETNFLQNIEKIVARMEV